MTNQTRYLAVDPRWPGGTPSDTLMTRTIYSGPRFVVFPDSWPSVGHYLNLGQTVALVLARESGDPAQYADWATADWMLDRVHWFVGNEMDGSGPASWTMTPAEYADLWWRSRVLHGRRWVGGLCSGDVVRARDYVQPDMYGLGVHIYTLNPAYAQAKVQEYQSFGRVWVGETHPADGYKLSDYIWPAGVNVTDFCYSNAMVPGLGLWA